MQVVYNVAWKELIRQVSVHCVERGFIMHRIFKAYLSILNRFEVLHEKARRDIGDKLRAHH